MQRAKQTQLLLDYLFKHESITASEAMFTLGIGRLASRIHDLKKAGYPITRKMVEVFKKDGSKTRVAAYHLEEEAE